MATLLGIDYGLKKIGLAIAPIDGRVSVPFRVIHYTLEDNILEELKKICEEENVEKIIIGIPESAWVGKKSEEQVKNVREFIKKLQEHIDVPFEEVNERLSSKEARRLLLGEPKDMEDAVAAMIILQSYLDSHE